MVFQAYNLFPHLSVLDNCTLAPVRVHGVPREGGGRARPRAARPVRPRGARRQAPRPPLRRPAAARRAGPRALHPARAAAPRRDHRRPRPRAGRRRAHDRPRPRRGRHDDGARHPRDELRPRGRDQGLLPRRRPDPRAGAALGAAGRAEGGADPAVPAPRASADADASRPRPHVWSWREPSSRPTRRRPRSHPRSPCSCPRPPTRPPHVLRQPGADWHRRRQHRRRRSPRLLPSPIPAAGDTIRVGTGNYTDGPYMLPAGVTLEGNGAGTVARPPSSPARGHPDLRHRDQDTTLPTSGSDTTTATAPPGSWPTTPRSSTTSLSSAPAAPELDRHRSHARREAARRDGQHAGSATGTRRAQRRAATR